MAHTDTIDVPAQNGPVDARPRLFSFDLFANYWISGLPLLVWVWIAATQSPLRNAISLGIQVVWVLGDLVIYLVRHRVMPPRPTWGKHNRWTVPLFFIVVIVRAVQGI
ncbi:MAG: hypothetical protein F4Y27_03675 [Acidimicrobiaceae bacterium]|nr:hypothetical protein [Acidimicrobiaceae bacterium]MYG56141.1 hypothetical protein [Acidimicrobiaceae bacterium]MYJ99861.1 hypothetical protein [Acidimicrobiaceae bacterium]